MLKSVSWTWHELTSIQKDWVTSCFSACGEVQRKNLGQVRYGQVYLIQKKTVRVTWTIFRISRMERLWCAHSELTGSVWLTQFGINGQCKIYMICWFLCTAISLMFAVVSIYKICACRRDNMWFLFPPTAFQGFCFLIRFSLKLGEIQEENPSPSGPVAKILCACFHAAGWWYSYSFSSE